ncbi:MAG: hypothetical protein WBZ36_05920 [Candidatus Nitrosopolaris sp.]
MSATARGNDPLELRDKALSVNADNVSVNAEAQFSENVSINGALTIDNGNSNDGALNNGTPAGNGLYFGNGPAGSGEGIASKRTTGGNQFGLDFYTAFTRRMYIDNNGTVTLTGNLNVTGGGDVTLADCAEEFDLSSNDITEPGTVMVLNEVGYNMGSQMSI